MRRLPSWLDDWSRIECLEAGRWPAFEFWTPFCSLGEPEVKTCFMRFEPKEPREPLGIKRLPVSIWPNAAWPRADRDGDPRWSKCAGAARARVGGS